MFAVVDRFRIVEKLGAKVWKCEDFSRDGETVVVKCLNDENELKILRALREYGDCFVNLYDSFKHRKLVHVVMEYFDYDLLEYLNENPIDEEERRGIFVRVFTAVMTLFHVTGYYHADLKAENIVINKRKNVKLIDFGVMIKKGEKISKLTGGTREYYPPEKIQRETGTTESFVVWTLGLILYRLLIGLEIPSDESGVTKSDIALTADVKYISEGAADLLRKCLHHDYRKRASLKDIRYHHWITGKKKLGLCC